MLTQSKDDKEKWQNSRCEACYTLSIEGIMLETKKVWNFKSFIECPRALNLRWDASRVWPSKGGEHPKV